MLADECRKLVANWKKPVVSQGTFAQDVVDIANALAAHDAREAATAKLVEACNLGLASIVELSDAYVADANHEVRIAANAELTRRTIWNALAAWNAVK